MTTLVWHEAHPPRGLDAAAVTRLVRVLANRPVRGIRQGVPVVVFEAWSFGGDVRWFIGAEAGIPENLPWSLCAQMPGLRLVRCPQVNRPPLTLAADVRLSTLSVPLRT
ncbi:hypothetical protein, partial [Actinomadura macra]|uniref:hypothetical protein n=1 Tax=Actinomadura macra TaxID=46164 RepID=UPI000A8A179E